MQNDGLVFVNRGREPFPSSEGYERPDWWSRQLRYDNQWYQQVLDNGGDVARVQLDGNGTVNSDYTNAPTGGGPWLKIQCIEVAVAARRRKIATRIVQELAELHPGRRLIAYSEGGDHFWDSLTAWDRYDHPNGASQPLYVKR